MQAKFQTQRLSDFTYIYSVQKSFGVLITCYILILSKIYDRPKLKFQHNKTPAGISVISPLTVGIKNSPDNSDSQ